MTIEKLPSGSYRIKQMVSGKTYRITVDHRPTKKEAEELIRSHLAESETYTDTDITFQKAAENYLVIKYDVLAPNTRRGYNVALKRLSDGFKQTLLNDLTQIIIQNEISRLSASCAPKTVKNTFGLIRPVPYGRGTKRCVYAYR